jgi:hypothetical protein
MKFTQPGRELAVSAKLTLLKKPASAQEAKFELRYTFKNSLYQISKNLLGYRDVNKRTHGDIIQTLESEAKRKLICVPRGCLKSSLACVAFPVYLLINNPNLRILIDSELYTNSTTFLREIKSHVQSSEFVSIFGNWKTNVWNESEIVISKRTRKLKEASITVGGVGTTKVGQHYDVIIGDDYNSPSNTNSSENAKKVIQHYRYNLSILEPDGTYAIVGTRYAANDLIGHILDNEETDLVAA